MKDKVEQLIDALDQVEAKSLSFVQLRRLNAALSDTLEKIAAVSANRSADDTLGDTVRVAVPPVRE
jgi:hypothetical protein